jgi:transcription-repair coupling factor (superfamily II helicase)
VKPRVEVQLRIDFLIMNPGEDISVEASKPVKKAVDFPDIQIAREVATYSSKKGSGTRDDEPEKPIRRASAFVPLTYVSESHHRIEIYRKLAQANDKIAVDQLRREMQDRFGRLPASVEFLLEVAGLKILASERGVTQIETKGEKLMITRNNDFIMLNGKFPRLMKKEPKARLGEIKRMLLAI